MNTSPVERGTVHAVHEGMIEDIRRMAAETRARRRADNRDGRAARERATFERTPACVECGTVDGRTACGALTCHDCEESANGARVTS